ncbi:hypothetical protein F4860DRAFT_200290 [Xylaria cubensis]|nr:hypothetical protein F4860DRAFT_200290 [Xylaria cubensis]
MPLAGMQVMMLMSLAVMRAYTRCWAARASSGSRLILTGIRRAPSQRTFLLGAVILHDIPRVLAVPVTSGDVSTDIAMESYKLAQTSYTTTVVMGAVMVVLAITSTTITIAQFRARRRDEQLRNHANNEADARADLEFLLRHRNRNRR